MLVQSAVLLLGLSGTCLAGPVDKDKDNERLSGQGSETCGYETCPKVKPGLINVHLVPHSHDDVGWLKTVDEYYTGSRNNIFNTGVQYILDTVVEQLAQNPERRFIQVETAFFWRWWHEQTNETQALVHTLVQEGRLEFIGGGWSMHDEAAIHYSALIDNMALGFRELKDIFGDCGIPKVSWQIDPFGHSRENAALFAQMGFDGLFFARIDYRDKAQRIANKTLQMVWEGSDHLGESSSIFTGAFHDHYSHPEGFCFDDVCSRKAEPIIDNHKLKYYNVDERVNEFVAMVKKDLASYQNPSHVMYTMGEDFAYQNAHHNYKNMDKLIKYVNEKTSETGVHVLYSTPSCFVKALNEEDETWQTKTDDFFPYASGAHSYWTGYYTSRPAFKYHERQSNNLFQAAKQVSVQTGSSTESTAELERAMGVSQHHDAITGTAKQAVDSDYNERLALGQTMAQGPMAADLFKNLDIELDRSGHYHCSQLNISSCQASEQQDSLVLLIYNPMPRSLTQSVRLPVSSSKAVDVFDDEGNNMVVQMVPIPQIVRDIPGRSLSSKADAEAQFLAEDVPALGYKAYLVKQTPTNDVTNYQLLNSEERYVEDKDRELPLGLSVDMTYYTGSSLSKQPSGAYIFRPRKDVPEEVATKSVDVVQGKDFTETRVVMDSSTGLSYIIRKYDGKQETEIEWLAGPINVHDNIGKEIIMRYTLNNLDNGGQFWTDANGRQMMERRRNERFSFVLTEGEKEPVSSNYYPVTTGMYIADSSDSIEMSVLTDRSQGGASINDGQIELMTHRRLLLDDHFGVNEALNEMAFGQGLVARGKHFIYTGPSSDSAKWRRNKMQEQYLSPIYLFAPTDLTLEQWTSKVPNKKASGLTRELPENVNILSLESVASDASQVVLRLEHLFQPDEHPTLSEAVKVDLDGLFVNFSVTGMTELTLGGNQPLANAERLHWNTDNFDRSHDRTHPMQERAGEDLEVELRPMEIRTFLLNVQRS